MVQEQKRLKKNKQCKLSMQQLRFQKNTEKEMLDKMDEEEKEDYLQQQQLVKQQKDQKKMQIEEEKMEIEEEKMEIEEEEKRLKKNKIN